MITRHFPHLPTSFYQYSEILKKIQDAGFSRITSPDAVLACLLCRVSASLDPGISIPNGSLNFISALIGSSGSGKSVAFQAARDLLPDIGTAVDGWGIGSGQGIAKTIAGKADANGVCEVVHSRVLFLADEGEQLLRVGRQEQSITMSTIRTAWSGGALGQTNATEGLTRNVGAGLYRFAMTIGLQPKFTAELLTGVHAGDPQRFLFSAVQHPEQPDQLPEFPIPMNALYLPEGVSTILKVDPNVTRLITEHRVKKQRGEIIDDPLDSHRHLMTLKVAGLLAILHGDDISVEWWEVAQQVVKVSRDVRRWITDLETFNQKAALMEKAESVFELQSIVDDKRQHDITESMLKSMINYTNNYGGPVNRSALANACSGQYKQIVSVDDVITEGLRRGELLKLGDLYGCPDRN